VKLNSLQKGILIALIHVALVCSLGAKLLMDRASRPRVWVKTVPYDPDLPIRGRYVNMRLEVETRGMQSSKNEWQVEWAHLIADGGKLVAVKNEGYEGAPVLLDKNSTTHGRLQEPVDYFIPEHAQDPSRVQKGEELWVEVTVPKKGPPRPIRLGIKRDNGDIKPLDVR